MTTMKNPMTHRTEMSHSNQMQQLYNQNAINSNAVPLSLSMTTINNSMINSNVMLHLNQMQQLYSQSAINNSQYQQQHQQQQLLISTPQSQPSYSNQYVHGHLTNTQLHNASRNVGPIVATPTTESIGLTSQPCNHILPTVQGVYLHRRIGFGLTRIPERTMTNGTNTAAYKVKKTLHLLEFSLPYKHITWQIVCSE